MTLKDEMIASIGYDPLTRMYYIEKEIKGYHLIHASYSERRVKEFISEKFRVIRALKFSLPRSAREDQRSTRNERHVKKRTSRSRRKR